VIDITENGTLIINMDVERWNLQIVAVIGENLRMVK
jgi:hypothetical protein